MYVNRKISDKNGVFISVQFKVHPFHYGTTVVKYVDISRNRNISMDLYYVKDRSESLYFKTWKEVYEWLRSHKVKRRGRWEIIESPRKVKLPENFHTKLL